MSNTRIVMVNNTPTMHIASTFNGVETTYCNGQPAIRNYRVFYATESGAEPTCKRCIKSAERLAAALAKRDGKS